MIVQESELSLVASHVLGAPASININVPLCVESLLAGVSAQCNARVLYRKNNTTGDIVRITAGATIPDNVTVVYNDNTIDANLANEILADFDAITTPKSKIFEAYGFRMIFVDASRPTDLYASQANKPWNVLASSQELMDAETTCIKRCFGAKLS